MTRLAYDQIVEVTQGFVPVAGLQNAAISLSLRAHPDVTETLGDGDWVYIRNSSGAPSWDRVTLAPPSITAYPNSYDVDANLVRLAQLHNAQEMQPHVYMVIAGSLEGQASRKPPMPTAIRGAFTVRTQRYTAGAYVPGDKVSLTSGLPVRRVTSASTLAKPTIGEVLTYVNDTTDRFGGLEISVRT